MRNTFESSEDGVHVNGRRISRYAGDDTTCSFDEGTTGCPKKS